MPTAMSKDEREAALEGVPEWHYDPTGRSIERRFTFKNFSEAFGFIIRVALAAQAANHHPDWSNSYNRVTIRSSSHDADGVTKRDFDLAKAIDALL